MKKAFVFFFSVLFAGSVTVAYDFKGVNFADEVNVAGKTLKLNGIGIRKVLVLHVYYAALYLKDQSSDAQAILASNEPKQIIMHFKRWVEKSKILDAWEDGFKKNKEPNYEWKEDFKKLKGAMVHMNENDRMVLTFLPDSAEIKVKDGEPLKIAGANFSKTLLKVFIHNAPDTSLKEGLLTLNK